jgi:predicted glutamine amidotransferase
VCGIVCAIGKPKHPKLSYNLLTALLKKTETRGDDATGFWATEGDTVLFSKEPTKSTEFVNKNKIWLDLENRNTDLIISHCRKKSLHIGSEKDNKNNHPFVSDDKKTALIHNGNVPEYEVLRDEYKTVSNCDSELLLRMFESGHTYDQEYLKKQFAELKIADDRKVQDLKDNDSPPEWANRLMGTIDIFARINYAALAVAVGELWEDGTKTLWLFRNKERPIHVIDMRPSLGQIFVVSTLHIWREGVEACPEAKQYASSVEIIEFPVNGIWMLSLKPNDEWDIKKLKTKKTRKDNTSWEKERPERKASKISTKQINLITNLDDKQDVITETVETVIIEEDTVIDTPIQENSKKKVSTTTTNNLR